METTLTFGSSVAASPQQAWAWITSFDGISKELSPLLRMSAPREARDLAAIRMTLGVPMFRSWIRFGGIVPIDFSDLTLVALTPGVGFVEQSRMGSMRRWRHERTVSAELPGCRIADTLMIEPRFGGRIAVAAVRLLFQHRHRMLRRYLGT